MPADNSCPLRPAANSPQTRPSRRDFLKTTSIAAVGLAGAAGIARSAHVAGSDVLKVGLVGCGGRGNGAAAQALKADPNTRLVALADPFAEKIQNTLEQLKKTPVASQVAVDADHCFDGFDGYQKVLASGVDVILLATPTHFRPMHLAAAVEAGAHVFCEKPVAVDAPGVRSILATCEAAKEKNLSIVSGLCWRYHPAVQATIERVLDGAIGRIASIQETYLTGFLWHRGRQPGDTEMKYQMRNWYYFTWLSGDHNVEQHVHSLDKALWAMGDEPPLRAWGTGGRQVRTDPMWGDIYDHHAVVYEYPDNIHVHAYCRQQGGCWRDTSDHFFGTQGHANILKNEIDGENPWKYDGPSGNMYDLEHEALFQSIRSGRPINNGQYMAYSTMLAILGRMVTYTGQAITWDDAINDQTVLAPDRYTWDGTPPTLPGEDGRYPVAMPGVA